MINRESKRETTAHIDIDLEGAADRVEAGSKTVDQRGLVGDYGGVRVFCFLSGLALFFFKFSFILSK